MDSVIYAYGKYHPQKFLEKYKYVKEEIETNNYIGKELKSDSHSGSDNIVIMIMILILKNKSDSNNNKQIFLTQ